MPAPTRPAPEHPGWCDPRACDAGTRLDVRHSGTPYVLRAVADDVEVRVALHRDDELTADGRYQPAAHGVSIDLNNVSGSTWPDGGRIRADVLLLPVEARALARRLLVLAELADRWVR